MIGYQWIETQAGRVVQVEHVLVRQIRVADERVAVADPSAVGGDHVDDLLGRRCGHRRLTARGTSGVDRESTDPAVSGRREPLAATSTTRGTGGRSRCACRRVRPTRRPARRFRGGSRPASPAERLPSRPRPATPDRPTGTGPRPAATRGWRPGLPRSRRRAAARPRGPVAPFPVRPVEMSWAEQVSEEDPYRRVEGVLGEGSAIGGGIAGFEREPVPGRRFLEHQPVIEPGCRGDPESEEHQVGSEGAAERRVLTVRRGIARVLVVVHLRNASPRIRPRPCSAPDRRAWPGSAGTVRCAARRPDWRRATGRRDGSGRRAGRRPARAAGRCSTRRPAGCRSSTSPAATLTRCQNRRSGVHLLVMGRFRQRSSPRVWTLAPRRTASMNGGLVCTARTRSAGMSPDPGSSQSGELSERNLHSGMSISGEMSGSARNGARSPEMVPSTRSTATGRSTVGSTPAAIESANPFRSGRGEHDDAGGWPRTAPTMSMTTAGSPCRPTISGPCDVGVVVELGQDLAGPLLQQRWKPVPPQQDRRAHRGSGSGRRRCLVGWGRYSRPR